jgi:phosphoglycolate phosphatase
MARDAIVFDLDGTLVDTAPDLHHALNLVLAGAGRVPLGLQDVRAMVGDGARKLIERGFAGAGEPLEPATVSRYLAEFLAHYERHISRLSRPFPGVVECLDRLAAEGVRFAVCTNKPERLSRLLLEDLGLLHRFGAVLGGDSLAVRKPDPGHLLATLAALNAVPERAVMVGDSANDVLAARAAAVPAIVVGYGYTALAPALLGADLVVDRFAELPAAIARLDQPR